MADIIHGDVDEEVDMKDTYNELNCDIRSKDEWELSDAFKKCDSIEC